MLSWLPEHRIIALARDMRSYDENWPVGVTPNADILADMVYRAAVEREVVPAADPEGDPPKARETL